MKIGILTFHKAQNNGAFLQCYALAREIAKRAPSHTVEVVDYTSAHLLRQYREGVFSRVFAGGGAGVTLKRLGKVLLSPRQAAAARAARRQQTANFAAVADDLPLSAQTLVSDDPAAFAAFLAGRYDVLIVGSDAVWNDGQTTRPNPYLLHDVKHCVKLSYAASAYGMDVGDLSPVQWDFARESFADFAYLGVRDDATAAYVRRADDSLLPVHNCDPTVLLPLNVLPVDTAALRLKLERHGVDFSRPVVGLMCRDRLAKAVRAHLGDGYQYVSVYLPNGAEDVFLGDLTPYEWARVFSLFCATFTHFFHGTLFSLKSGTPTFAVESASAYGAKYQTKIDDLLTRLDLKRECYALLDEMNGADWRQIAARVADPGRTFAVRAAAALEKEARTAQPFFEKLEEIIR